jgi:hypothetical protein
MKYEKTKGREITGKYKNVGTVEQRRRRHVKSTIRMETAQK